MKYPFLEFKNIQGFDFELSDKTDVLQVPEGAKLHLTGGIDGKKLYVTQDKLQAKKASNELKKYGLKVVTVVGRDDVLLYRKNYSKEQDGLNALNFAKIAKGDYDVIVTSPDALGDKFCDLKDFETFIVDLEVGKNYNLKVLSNSLVKAGYKREDEIFDFGDFSIRGDVVDVFPYGVKNPLRLSFFDDELESIKEIDLESGDKICEYKTVYLAPSSDLVFTKNSVDEVLAVNKLVGGRVKEIFSELIGGLKVGALSGRYAYLLPFLKTQSLLDLDLTVIFDEPKIVGEKFELYDKEFSGRFKSMEYGGEVTKRHQTAKLALGDIKAALQGKRLVGLSSLNLNNTLFVPKKTINLGAKAVTRYCYDYPSLVSDLKGFSANGFKIVLFCRNAERAKFVSDSLYEEGIAPVTGGEPTNGKITILCEDIEQGFLYPKYKLLVVGSVELVGKGR